MFKNILIVMVLMFSYQTVSAEGRLGVDVYFLEATGHSVNYRYYVDSENYIKIGSGTESVGVLNAWSFGELSYDFIELGYGYGLFEFFYKSPRNISKTGHYANSEVSAYPGISINFELKTSGWNSSMYAAITDLPAGITGLITGVTVSYTFGNVEHLKDRHYLKTPNLKPEKPFGFRYGMTISD
jgi:hypothetical protein